MKTISLLVVHCSATPAARDIGVAEIRAMHRAKGWRDVGYHYVIRRDGTVEKGRPDTVMGAHVQGHNANSLGICLVGGVKPDMTAETNFTPDQYAALEQLLGTLTTRHPRARVCGHRDLSPDRNGNGKVEPGEWVKACPTFDVAAWWAKREGAR
ncbi:N-acetylmuramoyl-L-alanine amidase [Brevundimonas sp. A19_0]|uniref:N-acetylmuramoyl-L-alanine amidase n=1 Tax=Brevundimonas sp. A19_0 TaxID=2821087 RepID=UPI001ADCAEFF|nr:N-acetylmuramoyl-L-alanine amidase [Brevundimonas sp. A19_0]MBO9500764.1 N-acetylmuramoyl-L-alanine amidase [Brevundimonas sp. A19_0]